MTEPQNKDELPVPSKALKQNLEEAHFARAEKQAAAALGEDKEEEE